MKAVIADASITSTNLLNTLQTINRETEQISDNKNAVEKFESCKQLRRRVLRYVRSLNTATSTPSLTPTRFTTLKMSNF